MIFRKFIKSDFEQIQMLYKECLNFEMDNIFYNYLFNLNGHFCSSVCEVNGKIVGHNAIIPRKYLFSNDEVILGLSSGGMVDPMYSGIFLNLLKYCISNFNGQGIIAFPNMKSEPFFTKILKFNSICDNYFTISKEQLNLSYDGYYIPKFIFHPESIEKRVFNHVKYKYLTKSFKDSTIIYKKYYESADIIFVSVFNKNLIYLLNSLFESGYKEINLIFNESKIPLEIGFNKKHNNNFVYNWTDLKFKMHEFNCQMIDSDVF